MNNGYIGWKGVGSDIVVYKGFSLVSLKTGHIYDDTVQQ